jgi:NADH:ubiquinone oxidoreductase subunit 6 (subunit J)
MEIVYFTVAAIFLYLFSDWLLNRIEKMMGKRSEYRSVIFFAIIMLLSFLLFNLVQYAQTGSTTDIQAETAIEQPIEK